MRNRVAVALLIGLTASTFVASRRSAERHLVKEARRHGRTTVQGKFGEITSFREKARKVLQAFLVATILALGLAGSVTFKADEGTAAALVTLCSVAMLFVGLLSRRKKDFVYLATLMSLVLAGLAAVFWILAERPADATWGETLQLLGWAFLSATVFGGIGAGVRIATLRN